MENDLTGDYQLAADVDCAGHDPGGDGKGFRPIGVGGSLWNSFDGHFDGSGHVIRNLTINRPLENDVGLFGLAGAAVIERVGLENVSITGFQGVGTVVGSTVDTQIREVYATGSVHGDGAGGLVGFLKHGGVLRDSHSRVTVGWDSQGGLLSDYVYYSAQLERSYSAGLGDEGRLYAELGEGGQVNASFFDCEVAGACSSAGGETTANLKSQSFLVAQGWDFTSTWAISSVDGYPCLQWQAGCSTPPDAGVDGGTDAGIDACTASGADTICDGVDDDCDGVADDDYASQSTSCGTGACARTGSTSCVNGSVQDSCTSGPPAAVDTICDGVDEDCSGTADEDYVSQSTSCGVGACAAAGSTACVSGNVVDGCTPGSPAASDATCDGIDENCSGVADEGYQAGTTSCVVGGCQATGTRACVGGVVVDDCTTNPQCVAELVCNDGVDNDNDGVTDCFDGDCAGTGCSPIEICNNTIDDDLDGAQDCADTECSMDPSCVVIPPDPAQVAPPTITAGPNYTYETTRFLFEGSNPIQRGVTPGAITVERAALLRGVVTNSQGSPLGGVRVEVHDHPELGHTITRTNGGYDLVVNGGDRVTLQYTAQSYLDVQRSVSVNWGGANVVSNVALTQLDSEVTDVALTGSETQFQVAIGSTSNDAAGSRTPVVMFPPGTQALVTLPNGTTQPLTAMTFRATEFTVGPNGLAAMPAEPAAHTAYTYAIELSADEVLQAGGTGITFSQPVLFYVDDFIGVPVGSIVPTGYYDRQRTGWIGMRDGRVIHVVSLTAAGSAEVDVTGDGAADSLSTLAILGFTQQELDHIGALYTPGKKLWRVMLDHFSPVDCNFAYLPRLGAPLPAPQPPPQPPQPPQPNPDPLPPPPQPPEPPPAPQPEDNPPKEEESDECGDEEHSTIHCINQAVSESVPIAGTDLSMVYYSRHAREARRRSFKVSILGSTIDPDLLRSELTVTAAGKSTSVTFSPQANRVHHFEWDGLDTYGRAVDFPIEAGVRLCHIYRAYYAVRGAPIAEVGPGTFG
jgi:hypothetical protein